MNESTFFNGDFFIYAVLPALIFLARICDVTLDTLRIIFVSKGKKHLAPLLGFFEILIWLLAITKIMQNLDNIICYIAYAAGFATGNYVGLLVEEKLAMGIMIIRIITPDNVDTLMKTLNEHGFGSTVIEAKGSMEKVHLIYSIVQRNDLQSALKIIERFNPKTFYAVEDVKFVNRGIFPLKKNYSTSFLSHLKQMGEN